MTTVRKKLSINVQKAVEIYENCNMTKNVISIKKKQSIQNER